MDNYNSEYAFFKGHDSFPSDLRSTVSSLQNTWRLAETSTLVYAEPDLVLRRFKNADPKEAGSLDPGSPKGFGAANDRFAIVGFRGSEVPEHEWKFDFLSMAGDFFTDDENQ